MYLKHENSIICTMGTLKVAMACILHLASKLTSTHYVHYLGLDKRNAFAINKAIFYLDC